MAGDWPILVGGGLNSFTKALLFNRPLVRWDETDNSALQHPIFQSSDADLWEFLHKVDPQIASQIHPSFRRKVADRLELYFRMGRPPSDIFRELREVTKTRWPTLIFWLRSEKKPLDQRLSKRVDDMIAQGVEQEFQELYQMSRDADAPIAADLSPLALGSFLILAVLMAGYQEFPPFAQGAATDDSASKEAITWMKTKTKLRAHQQARHIRYQFIPLARINNIPTYILDVSDPSQWSTKVLEPAARVCRAFLSGSTLPPPAEIFERANQLLTKEPRGPEFHKPCEISGNERKKIIIEGGEDGQTVHRQGRKHQRALKEMTRKVADGGLKAAAAEGDKLES
jgi:tRNA dimethylallyltransferase